MKVFYDLVYSEDDGGYYCQVFDAKGKDLFETRIHKTSSSAKLVVCNKYPGAELLNTID